MINMRAAMRTVATWTFLVVLTVTHHDAHSTEVDSRPAAPPASQPANPARDVSSRADPDAAAEKRLTDAFIQSKTPDPARALLVEKAIHDCYVTDTDVCNRALTLHDRQWKEEFDERSYRWHLFSTKLIFFLVILIVVFGLYITYVQFNRDYHDWSPPQHHLADTAKSDVTAAVDGAAPVVQPRPISTFKMGPGGLELSSQVIGLIVLALSFGFFYLYVKEVYPMVESKSLLTLPADLSSSK
jgi:hypothetical protein